MSVRHDFFRSGWMNKANRLYLIIGSAGSILSWMLFKQFYPNTHIVFDSYYYILAAFEKAPVHVWPIGYSEYLRLIRLVSHSPNIVVASQYFFLQLCLLLFFFTMRFLFNIGRRASLALFLFIWLNPIYLYTSNFILSDGLFLAISMLWLVNLMRIVYRPKPWMLLTQALLLFFAFTIRQTALVYPIIACVAILLSRQRLAFKLGGIVVPFLFVGGFILYSIHMNEVKYGVKTFSAFQGWHAASNALYVYEHVPPEEREPVPTELKQLDTLVNAYYRSKHIPVDITTPDPSSGCYYIFMYPSPLLIYELSKFGPDRHFLINPATFTQLGPLYGEYGSYILRKYPVAYFQHFILPNVYLYLYPQPEAYLDNMRSFNLARDTLGAIAKKWFGNDLTLAASAAAIGSRTTIFSHYQLVDTWTHVIFLLSAVAFVVFKGFKKLEASQKRLLWLFGALWIIQFGFTVLAAASVFRFQLFITVVEFALLAFFIEFLVNMESPRPAG